MAEPRILAFAGSTRDASLNKKLSRVAAEHAKAAGARVSWIDLRDYPMPLYDGDLEAKEGVPPNGLKLKELFKANDALFLSCPEYNGSTPAVLKNAIDWVSRPAPGEKPLECFEGKVAGLVSASPGQFGAARSLVAMQGLLLKLNMTLIGETLALGKAHEAFEDDGRLKDPKVDAIVKNIASRLVEVAGKMRG